MLRSTTGATKPLPPPANLNSLMVLALVQAAGNQPIRDKTDMQATLNHLITSFVMLVQGVSDGRILRALVDTANARIVEIIHCRTCFTAADQDISKAIRFALNTSRANPRLLPSPAGMARGHPTPTAMRPPARQIVMLFTISRRAEPYFPRPLPITCILVSSSFL